MANAKTDEVEVMVPTMEKRYVLTLTEDEAQYLSALLGNRVVGNGPVRQLNSAIWNALASEVGEFYLSNTGGGMVDVTSNTTVYEVPF